VGANAVFTTTVQTARLSGSTLDAANGAGLAANIFVYQGSTLVASTVASAPEGRYQFGEELPAGTYTVTAAKYGYVPQTADNVIVTEGASTTVDFLLTASAALEGRVTDATTGAPLAAATIELCQDGVSVASTTTGADGCYRIDGLPEGVYSATASQPGYISLTTEINATSGVTASLDFALVAASPVLTGQITDSGSGAAVADATIGLYQNRRLLVSTTSALDGSYRMDTGLPPGAYTVSVFKSGYRKTSRSVWLEPGVTTASFDLKRIRH
jgi:hypothetical protein